MSTATEFSDAVKAGALARDVSTDGVIAALWDNGRGHFDTRDIARLLSLRESEVANRLAKIRDGERA